MFSCTEVAILWDTALWHVTHTINTCIATIIRILSRCLQMLEGQLRIDYLFFFMTHGCFSESWPFKSLAGVCGNFVPEIDQVLNRVQMWFQWNPSKKLNFDSCNSNSSGRVELFLPSEEIISQKRQMCFECNAMLLIFSLVKEFIKPKNLHSARAYRIPPYNYCNTAPEQ